MKMKTLGFGSLLCALMFAGAVSAQSIPIGATRANGDGLDVGATALVDANGHQAGIAANPLAVSATVAPSATFNPGNPVSVSTTATLVVAARTGRSSITIENEGTTPVYIGNSASVTPTTSRVLLPGSVGASITLNYTGAVYGITASGSQTVSEYELY